MKIDRGSVRKKLSNFETYVALMKGYCVLSILLCPKAFSNAGWGMASIFIISSGVISLLACNMLVDTGLSLKIYSYPLIVQQVLGKKWRVVLEVAIALTQYSFAISHLSFFMQSIKSTVDSLFQLETSMMPYAIAVCIIFSTISWVRDLAKFSFTFIVGNILIITAVIFVTVQANKLMGEQNGTGPDFNFINSDFLTTLGFSIYTYEGIGIVMPVMATCE